MVTLEQIKDVLNKKKTYLSNSGITEIGLFGSYLRGDEKPDSDVDILIDVSRPSKLDLLDLITIENELSEELGLPVDLVLKSSLKPGLSKSILSEVIYL